VKTEATISSFKLKCKRNLTQVQSGSIWYNYSMRVLFNPSLEVKRPNDPLFCHRGGLSHDKSDGGSPHVIGKNSITLSVRS